MNKSIIKSPHYLGFCFFVVVMFLNPLIARTQDDLDNSVASVTKLFRTIAINFNVPKALQQKSFEVRADYKPYALKGGVPIAVFLMPENIRFIVSLDDHGNVSSIEMNADLINKAQVLQELKWYVMIGAKMMDKNISVEQANSIFTNLSNPKNQKRSNNTDIANITLNKINYSISIDNESNAFAHGIVMVDISYD